MYTCESIVTESFQPFHSEVPGMHQVSGSDGFFQPRPLKDINMYMQIICTRSMEISGKWAWLWKKSVTSIDIVEFERRQICQLNRYIPRILGSGNSGRMLCFGASRTSLENSFVFEFMYDLYSEIPVQYRSRLDWVMKEHRACKRREKSSERVVHCESCS